MLFGSTSVIALKPAYSRSSSKAWNSLCREYLFLNAYSCAGCFWCGGAPLWRICLRRFYCPGLQQCSSVLNRRVRFGHLCPRPRQQVCLIDSIFNRSFKLKCPTRTIHCLWLLFFHTEQKLMRSTATWFLLFSLWNKRNIQNGLNIELTDGRYFLLFFFMNFDYSESLFFLGHGRVGPVLDVKVSALDGLWGDEARGVERTACLVVGSWLGSSTKPLLANHRTGRLKIIMKASFLKNIAYFVIDIKVSGSLSKFHRQFLNKRFFFAINSTSKSVN